MIFFIPISYSQMLINPFCDVNDQMAAVKRLDTTGVQGEKEFLVEVLMLSLLHHPNLVSMIGYCAEGDQRLLVYEYMPLGSLESHLHGNAMQHLAFSTSKLLIRNY